MAAQEALENRITDAFVAALSAIGQPGAVPWLTTGQTMVGDLTQDALDSVDPAPRLYVHHTHTTPDPQAQSLGRHGWQVGVTVWLVGKDKRTVNQLHADALRALYAYEATFVQLFGRLPVPGQFLHRTELIKTGADVGQFDAYVPVDTDHLAT